MLGSRLFEEAVMQLWNDGKISGEMHLGIGEEAIAAGVVSRLRDGDAMALDHRGTAPLFMRGVDPVPLLLEFLGHPEGLCSGMGGHMHLYSRPHLAASSGIVGASGPAAVGFALAARHLRPGAIAVAFFGEGATNQGMLMESFNLSAVWNLPVIFVCKDNKWSISTLSESVTAGRLTERARSFGMHAAEADGSDVLAVTEAVRGAIERARAGNGPSFLHMHCVRPEGHFLGDPLLRVARHPIKEMKEIAGPLLRSVSKVKGSSLLDRVGSLRSVSSVIGRTVKLHFSDKKDPVDMVRKKLESDKDRLEKIEKEAEQQVRDAVDKALKIAQGQGQGVRGGAG